LPAKPEPKRSPRLWGTPWALVATALYGGSISAGWTMTWPSPLKFICQLSPVLPRIEVTDELVTAACMLTASDELQPRTASASAK
jgi:hypothetical protein